MLMIGSNSEFRKHPRWDLFKASLWNLNHAESFWLLKAELKRGRFSTAKYHSLLVNLIIVFFEYKY